MLVILLQIAAIQVVHQQNIKIYVSNFNKGKKKKKIYFGNLKNYSKRINVKLPITKTTDIHIEKV